MIFGYWHNNDHRPIRAAIQAWRALFPDFQIIGDSDIEPIIARRHPNYLEVYQRIRIPCAKSGLARLIALNEWGGLYVDCHCGIRDPHFVHRLLDSLDTFELIVSYKNRTSDGWPPIKPHPTPSFLFAQRDSKIALQCVTTAFQNLTAHWKAEKENGYFPYMIWLLVGTGVLHEAIIDWDAQPPTLKPHLVHKIWVLPEDRAPIIRHMYNTYNEPGMHWSERQKHELLFG